MNIKIERRVLTLEETKELEAATREFPDIGFISRNMWKKFGACYVIHIDEEMAGACGSVPLQSWLKIGPLIILKGYQGLGLGKHLVKKIVFENKGKNLYIGSSNLVVAKIVEKLNFTKVQNVLCLPLELRIYQIKYFFERLSTDFLVDALRKKRKKGKYYYFLREQR